MNSGLKYGITAMVWWLVSTSVFAAALSPRDYALLERVNDLVLNEQFDQAHEQLVKAKDRVRSDYGRALVFHNLANIELQRERYAQALVHLEEAYSIKALPEGQQVNTQLTLAQLYCMEGQWQSCIQYAQGWLKAVPEADHRASHYMLLAQANGELERWREVIDSVSKAIALKTPAPLSWYQLKVAAQMQLKQWQAAISTQKTLLNHYPGESLQWRRLVSLQLEIRDFKAALASQRIALEQGLLRESTDYRLLTQLMLQEGIPFHGARLLNEAIETGVVASTEANLQLVASSWLQANESERLVSALMKLNDVAPSKQRMEQLAQMQIELQQWAAAQKTLLAAIQQYGPDNIARLQLLLGITRIKLKAYPGARQALMAATDDESLQPSANSWLRFLEQVEG